MLVKFDGKVYKIIGQIHTHPIFGFINSNDDDNLSKELGIPIYNIHGNKIFDSDGNIYGTINSPSSKLFQ